MEDREHEIDNAILVRGHGKSAGTSLRGADQASSRPRAKVRFAIIECEIWGNAGCVKLSALVRTAFASKCGSPLFHCDLHWVLFDRRQASLKPLYPLEQILSIR